MPAKSGNRCQLQSVCRVVVYCSNASEKRLFCFVRKHKTESRLSLNLEGTLQYPKKSVYHATIEILRGGVREFQKNSLGI